MVQVVCHCKHYAWTWTVWSWTCELDMINVISAADITFIMSSSTSAWLLSPLECSPQKQNGWTLRFCFWGWIMWKMYNKTIIEFGFRMISWIIKTSCLCYLPQPSASADNTDLGFDNSWYHAQPHPIIVYYYCTVSVKSVNILAPVVQKVDNAIHRINYYQWMAQLISLLLIHWIVIYPAHSAIHRLNNWRLYQITRHCNVFVNRSHCL